MKGISFENNPKDAMNKLEMLLQKEYLKTGKEKYFFKVGEYAALYFNREITRNLIEHNVNVKFKDNFTTTTTTIKENKTDVQFVTYRFHNGVIVTLLIDNMLDKPKTIYKVYYIKNYKQ